MMIESGSSRSRDLLLASPPRAVPLALRLRLIGNAWLLVGALVTSGGLIMAAHWCARSGLQAAWTLSRESASAEGWIVKAASLNMEINDQPVYRVDYRFIAPDEQPIAGTSYGRGSTPAIGAAIEVDYAPSQPSINRARGTSLTPAPVWVPMILLVPGMLLLVGGVMWARSRLRPLHYGQLAIARIKMCQAAQESAAIRSLEDLHKHFAKVRMHKDVPEGPVYRFGQMTGIFLFCFTVLGVVLTVGVTIFLAMRKQSDSMLILGLLIAVGWMTMGLFISFLSFSWLRQIKGALHRVYVKCAYEFAGPDGQPVESFNHFTADEQLGADEGQEMVLYDPANPRDAILLRALPVPITFSSRGEVETQAGMAAGALRVASSAGLLAAGIAFYAAS